MTNERVALVLGARGTLGKSLAEELPRAGWTVAAAVARAECDIRAAAAVRALIAGTRPDGIFNATAYTDVDKAALEPDAALLSARDQRAESFWAFRARLTP
jgi:dTDP-4-dehydrorhamnose reductase